MGTDMLTEKNRDALNGVLHCFDRVIFDRHHTTLEAAQRMASYLYAHDIRVFDFV
jgi:hypothetical protein